MPIDLSLAYRTLQKMGLTLVASLPRIAVGIILVLAFYFIGSTLSWIVIRSTQRIRRRGSLELAVGRLVHAAVIAIGILVGASVVFPSFTAASLIQLLGVSGIAIGFAFKDIFQNFLAGILLLITEPFDIGDQIVVDAYEGTVDDIQTRATLITTYDHRRVVVPNTDLFTKSVTVNTAFMVRRSEYDAIAPATVDVDALKTRIAARLDEVPGVSRAPAPDALLVKFDPATVTLRVRWWTDPQWGTAIETMDRVLIAVREEIKNATPSSSPPPSTPPPSAPAASNAPASPAEPGKPPPHPGSESVTAHRAGTPRRPMAARGSH